MMSRTCCVGGDVAARFLPGNHLGRIDGAAVDEDGQAAEEELLSLAQQVMAPIDRLAHGAEALGLSLRATGEERQPVIEPVEKSLG